MCKFHPPIDLIPTTQYPYSNLIQKRAFDLRAYGTPHSECSIYLVPGTLCRRDNDVYGGTAKCHKAFFKPHDYRSVFYLVKPSCFPPPLPSSILSKSPLKAFAHILNCQHHFYLFFFLRGGAGGTFHFLHVAPDEESAIWKMSLSPSPAARWGGGGGREAHSGEEISFSERNGSDGGCGVFAQISL